MMNSRFFEFLNSNTETLEKEIKKVSIPEVFDYETFSILLNELKEGGINKGRVLALIIYYKKLLKFEITIKDKDLILRDLILLYDEFGPFEIKNNFNDEIKKILFVGVCFVISFYSYKLIKLYF